MNPKQTAWLVYINRQLNAALAIVLILIASEARAQSPIVVQSISDMAALNTTGMTNDTVVYVVDYYGASQMAARGGGNFHWVSNNCCLSSAGGPGIPDGGRFIACTTGNTNGIWERLLNGSTPNVKMWGAYGDGLHDDTAAISNALYGIENWGNGSVSVGGLLFPAGTYLVTNTLVFNTHIAGEGPLNTTVMMAYGVNKDIFHSYNADNWINSGSGSYDHGLQVENMKICFQTSGTNLPPILRNTQNAALVIGVPGELSTIRNVHTMYGGIGICAMGGGAPGVNIKDCKTDDCIIGVAIVPLPGHATGDGGPTTIDGLSGDQIEADIGPVASLVLISNVFSGTSISGIKAESDWGGGLIHYYSVAADQNMELLTIRHCHFNAGPITGQTNPAPDFLVIDPSSGFAQQGPIITMEGIGSYGIGNLIRDNIGDRLVDADIQTGSGNYQIANSQTITYQANFGGAGYPTNWTTGSALFMGQTAITTFAPTNAGWYRIMAGANLSGRVSIVNPYGYENIELEVDCSASHTPWINVNRCKKGPQVVITQARAITYSDTFIDGEWSFVDVYVANPISMTSSDVPYRKNRLIVSLDTAGNTGINLLTPQLLSPIIAVSDTPPSGSSSVTNNTYR